MRISIKIEPWSAQKAPSKNIYIFWRGLQKPTKTFGFLTFFGPEGAKTAQTEKGSKKVIFLDLNGKC